MSVWALGAFLAAGLALALGAVALWESRRRRAAAEPQYVIREAIAFAAERVDRSALERLGKAGVGRVVEWSAHYLQGLAVPSARRRGLRVVAGGEEGAVEFIRESLLKKGFDYSPEDIGAVLAAEAEYLLSIGAVGEPVGEDETKNL